MILLLGGTSETAPLASALALHGFKVLVSMATDLPLDIGNHQNISRRSGMLEQGEMAKLVVEKGIQVIVDASHPYASSVRFNARSVAAELGVPYLTWVRPTVAEQEHFIHFAADHELAAIKACSFGRPVLLTTGSRNLEPYVREARRTKVPLVARVLSNPESVHACIRACIPHENIVTGRGPFSLEENLSVIRRYAVGCIVTKDSGKAGGVPAKIEAARTEGCQVVVVQRPGDSSEASFADLAELIAEVQKTLRSRA